MPCCIAVFGREPFSAGDVSHFNVFDIHLPWGGFIDSDIIFDSICVCDICSILMFSSQPFGPGRGRAMRLYVVPCLGTCPWWCTRNLSTSTAMC